MLLVVGKHDSYVDQPQQLRLRSLLNGLIDGVENGEISVDCQCPLDVVIECWPIPLRRALENLLRNADKAAREAVEGRIRIRVHEHHADAVKIIMENNGGQFPDAVLKNISRRLSLRVRGGEIGLTVVREVIRRHSGKVALRNLPPSEGWTARVDVTLPVRQKKASRWRRRIGLPGFR